MSTTRYQIDETTEHDIWLCAKPWWLELIIVAVTAITPGLPSVRFCIWAFRDQPVSGVAEDEEAVIAGVAKIAGAFMVLAVQMVMLGMLVMMVVGG